MSKNKKVAIFKLDTDDFEIFFNHQLVEHGCTVISFSSLLKDNTDPQKLEFSLKKILSLKLEEYDIIIVFEILKIVPLIRLKIGHKARLILWNWNKKTIQVAKREKLVSLFCEIWTFDPNDAKEFGWMLNNQFYMPQRMAKYENNNLQKRAFCVCLDKSRYQLIKKIRKQLLDNNVYCDFILVKDGSSNYDPEDSEWVREMGIPYGEILHRVSMSDILIDFVKPGQSGLTMRTMEALFYKKKIITNNISILEYPFYNDDNILIMDHMSENELSNFLQSDYVDIKREYLIPYTYESWIDNFFKNEETRI